MEKQEFMALPAVQDLAIITHAGKRYSSELWQATEILAAMGDTVVPHLQELAETRVDSREGRDRSYHAVRVLKRIATSNAQQAIEGIATNGKGWMLTRHEAGCKKLYRDGHKL